MADTSAVELEQMRKEAMEFNTKVEEITLGMVAVDPTLGQQLAQVMWTNTIDNSPFGPTSKRLCDMDLATCFMNIKLAFYQLKTSFNRISDLTSVRRLNILKRSQQAPNHMNNSVHNTVDFSSMMNSYMFQNSNYNNNYNNNGDNAYHKIQTLSNKVMELHLTEFKSLYQLFLRMFDQALHCKAIEETCVPSQTTTHLAVPNLQHQQHQQHQTLHHRRRSSASSTDDNKENVGASGLNSSNGLSINVSRRMSTGGVKGKPSPLTVKKAIINWEEMEADAACGTSSPMSATSNCGGDESPAFEDNNNNNTTTTVPPGSSDRYCLTRNFKRKKNQKPKDYDKFAFNFTLQDQVTTPTKKRRPSKC